VASFSQAFAKLGARTSSSTDIPEKIVTRKAIDADFLRMSKIRQDLVNEIIDSMWVLLVKRGCRKEDFTFTRPIIITDYAGGKHITIVCMNRQKKPPFSGEFTILEVGSVTGFIDELPDLPFNVRMNTDATIYPIAKPLLAIYTETEMAKYLVEHGTGPFSFRIATEDDEVAVPRGVIRIASIGAVVDIEEARANALQLAASIKAFKMFKQSLKPWFQTRRRSRAKAKPKSDAKAMPAAKKEKGVKTSDVMMAHECHASSEETEGSSACSVNGKASKAFKLFVAEDAKKTLRDSIGAGNLSSEEESSSETDPVLPDPSGGEASRVGPDVLSSGAASPSDPGGGAAASSTDPSAGAAASATPLLMPARAEQQSLTDFLVDVGSIKIDRKRKQLNAHCPHKLHFTEATQKCTLNRKCIKAPIGMLVAWIRIGHVFLNRPDHLDSVGILSLSERQEAREWAESQPALLPLLEFEAECLGVSVGSVKEPGHCS
jgi:hypothetical protein